MLFNSVEFLFLFLPILLIGFFALGRRHQRAAALWLALGSLFFYAWWDSRYLLLLLASIGFNYAIGLALARLNGRQLRWRGALLAAGVSGDLLLLAYYKYANFFVDTLNALAGTHHAIGQIVLPLGISFFTFTQIAFLVDAARGKAREFNFVHYLLFVTYFPHLIAGPVLHHSEMMPQFGKPATYRINAMHLAVGFSVFALGLFKKVMLADNVAPYAAGFFAAAQQGEPLTLLQAWGGVLAYTLQLYFDFSGYSDMAIGLSFLIGVRLPLNFNSPYRAVNIADFWRRWHMTLSRFLRDYLYIPLGGNRHGARRRYANLMATMLLGGLWHGAGWTFVVWGGLHGLYLVIHQAWQLLRLRLGQDLSRSTRLGRATGVATTFLAVVVAWVFFRASDVHAAFEILRAMAGLNGISLPEVILSRLGPAAQQLGITAAGGGREFVLNWLWVLTLLPVVFLAPNVQQLMAGYHPAHDHDALEPVARKWRWAPTRRWAVALSLALACGLMSLTRPTEFLYFQF
jgi:D-alanyl-lipoteichoic acid acyltransferase DltB (MBOAT superfamily)